MIDPHHPDYSATPASAKRPPFAYAAASPAAPPAVTIVTPFYNTGPEFNETALSVQKQSFQQWEWLIINDGTTAPESLAILDKYRQRDPRIKVIDHEHNKGLSAARNTGYAAAGSEFVLQLDSDDLIEPTAVEKWFWCLTSHPEYGFVNGYSLGFGAEQYVWKGGFGERENFLQWNRVNANVMVRKAVHAAVGGYDESLRQGLEDWEFWLHCVDAGYWGYTVPEFLTWYRRRPSHGDRWQNLQSKKTMSDFRDTVLRQRYARLYDEGGFPTFQPPQPGSFDPLPETLPAANLLAKDKPRLLMIMPWMHMGGSDKFNLDLLRGLAGRGWEVTVATTIPDANSWLPEFAAHTPDVFILDGFLRLVDYPRFLRYLITSRRFDAVLPSQSELAYLLLPYLRAHFPDLPIIDYCHMEEEGWKNGGYPRLAVDYQELLTLNVVSSQHLKEWMVKRGADSERVRVCYTNIDADQWQPNAETRQAVRHELAIARAIPMILFAGRLMAQKQPRVLAQTLLQLKQSGQQFVAVIAGSGPARQMLSSFIAEHELDDQVRLLGEVSELRMRQLMPAADIFFLPSRQEGIALSIFEAMACAVPVLGADVGGQSELVTPDCGVLLARSDQITEAGQYATVLADLLHDVPRRQTMGAAARARIVAGFRLGTMIDTMISLLEEGKQRAASDPVYAPSLALGKACAANAVEITRLSELTQRLRQQQAAAAGEKPPAADSTLKKAINALPWRVRRPLRGAIAWFGQPSGPLAPVPAVLKRMIPRFIKVRMKRAIQ